MRKHWNHDQPDNVQDCPDDNTEEHIRAQVRVWRDTGKLIHPETAMEIAAWWQSAGPAGIGFAYFASTGTFTESLWVALPGELATATDPDARAALEAFTAYLTAVMESGEDDYPGAFCERCGEWTRGEEIDEDCGLCPACVDSNAGRVVL